MMIQNVYVRILGLPTLKYCRLRGDMILLYRLINNDIGIDFADFLPSPQWHQQEVICTSFKSLTQPAEWDVIFSRLEQLTVGTNMLLQQGLLMNLMDDFLSEQFFDYWTFYW